MDSKPDSKAKQFLLFVCLVSSLFMVYFGTSHVYSLKIKASLELVEKRTHDEVRKLIASGQMDGFYRRSNATSLQSVPHTNRKDNIVTEFVNENPPPKTVVKDNVTTQSQARLAAPTNNHNITSKPSNSSSVSTKSNNKPNISKLNKTTQASPLVSVKEQANKRKQCPDLLRSIQRGHWVSRSAKPEDLQEVESFLNDTRWKHYEVPETFQRLDGKCGELVN